MRDHSHRTLNLLLLLILSFAFFIRPTKGDVSVSKPLSGLTFSASSGKASIQIEWIESNAVPLLTKIKSYTFLVCTGPNANVHCFSSSLVKVSADDLSSYTHTTSVDASLGADGLYYIQIYAATSDGYTIHYTNRFTLTDMTGTYVPSGSDASPPSAQTSISGGTAVVSIDSKSFSVPYIQQTGKTRYAPMQTQPGTKVTRNKSSWSRRFSTSAVTYFSTIKDSLEQVSTITPGWSYTISSAVNWASPAVGPTTWYAASERLTRTPTIATPTILNQKSSSTTSSTTVQTTN